MNPSSDLRRPTGPLRRNPCALLVLAAVLAPAGLTDAFAQASAQSQPRWEFGAFALAVSQQAYPGADQQVSRQLLLPYFIYRGDVLRADRETTGLRAFRQGAFEFDLGAAASLAVQGDRIDARRGLPGWGALVEVGPRLRWTLHQSADGSRWRLDLPLRAVLDAQNGLAHRGTAFEPELRWQGRLQGGWFINAGVSAIVGDERLAQTYYGVSTAAATTARPAYAAQAGLISSRLSLSSGRRFGQDWNAFGYVRLDSVAGAANERSPLIRQATGATAGIGVAYVWRRSSQAASD